MAETGSISMESLFSPPCFFPNKNQLSDARSWKIDKNLSGIFWPWENFRGKFFSRILDKLVLYEFVQSKYQIIKVFQVYSLLIGGVKKIVCSDVGGSVSGILRLFQQNFTGTFTREKPFTKRLIPLIVGYLKDGLPVDGSVVNNDYV